MGCTHFVEEDEVIIEIIDYSTGEFLDHLVVDSDRFEENKMKIEVKGTRKR